MYQSRSHQIYADKSVRLAVPLPRPDTADKKNALMPMLRTNDRLRGTCSPQDKTARAHAIAESLAQPAAQDTTLDPFVVGARSDLFEDWRWSLLEDTASGHKNWGH